jgi:hypothetical protein
LPETPDNERRRKEKDRDLYYPIRIVASFPLDALPEEQIFLETCEQREEEEEPTTNDAAAI